MPFNCTKASRTKLHKQINNRFSGSKSFTYTSARGALADFLLSIGLGENDEVLLSSFTCLAVPTAVIASGARPTYCDIDPGSMNQTLETVLPAITSNTRVIIVQHTLGSVAEIQPIIEMAHKRDIIVVEDCALSIGTVDNGKMVGTFGDAAIFSMELSKTISIGWGGILIINNSDMVASLSKRYKNHKILPLYSRLQMAIQTAISGFCYHPNIYFFGRFCVALLFKIRFFNRSTPDSEYTGEIANNFISKLGNPQVQLAIHQWKRLDKIANSCMVNGQSIIKLLEENGYQALGTFNKNERTVSPRVPFLINDRKSIMEWFHKRNLELGSWFDGPLSPLPKSAIFNYIPEDFPQSLSLSKHIVNIPCHNRLTSKDLNKIKSNLENYSKK